MRFACFALRKWNERLIDMVCFGMMWGLYTEEFQTFWGKMLRSQSLFLICKVSISYLKWNN